MSAVPNADVSSTARAIHRLSFLFPQSQSVHKPATHLLLLPPPSPHLSYYPTQSQTKWLRSSSSVVDLQVSLPLTHSSSEARMSSSSTSSRELSSFAFCRRSCSFLSCSEDGCLACSVVNGGCPVHDRAVGTLDDCPQRIAGDSPLRSSSVVFSLLVETCIDRTICLFLSLRPFRTFLIVSIPRMIGSPACSSYRFMGGNSTKATSGINGAGTQSQQEAGIQDSAKIFFEDTKKSVRPCFFIVRF